MLKKHESVRLFYVLTHTLVYVELRNSISVIAKMYSSVAIYDSGLLRQITDSQRRFGFGGLELYGSISGVRGYYFIA